MFKNKLQLSWAGKFWMDDNLTGEYLEKIFGRSLPVWKTPVSMGRFPMPPLRFDQKSAPRTQNPYSSCAGRLHQFYTSTYYIFTHHF
jgi:hypothetical protein